MIILSNVCACENSGGTFVQHRLGPLLACLPRKAALVPGHCPRFNRGRTGQLPVGEGPTGRGTDSIDMVSHSEEINQIIRASAFII